MMAPPHHSPPCPPVTGMHDRWNLLYLVGMPSLLALEVDHGLSLLMRNGKLHSLSINGSQLLSVGMRSAVAPEK